ncbi:MAG: arsenite S-adenosylmethyltransferase [Anaerolinea sp.]|nr:arsenite S-adenosylmethyltransferase [Anaerolinea sp.]
MATARTDDEIRSEVSKAYGSRVKGTLARADEIPLVQANSCCATETATEASCCGDTTSDIEITNIARLYADANVSDLPSTVTDVAFGCGNPTAIAALKPGQVVLDLGSGGGIDCFLAAKMVGETGRVYGVDMTPEMIALARKNREKVGATNVEFRLGEIEHLPISDDSVDVIISNCVINLSPDKDQVFREAFRALKPGGRLQVSDIVWTKPVPDEVKDDMEQWAGCIAGALVESDYLGKIRAAGFTDVVSTAAEYPGGKGIASAAVVAVKPGGVPSQKLTFEAATPGACCAADGSDC